MPGELHDKTRRKPIVVWLVLATILASLSGAGCRSRSAEPQAELQRAQARQYGALRLTRDSLHSGLRAELQAIEQENGLPQQMTARRTSSTATRPGWIREDGRQIDDAENLAAVLASLFASDELEQLSRSLNSLYPAEAFEWNDKSLAAARELRGRFAEPLERFQHALGRPHCEFAFQYAEGYLADQQQIKTALAANRLLGIQIAELLADRDFGAAVDTWPRLLVLPAALNHAGNLTARAAAARLRSEALRILQVLARHDKLDLPTVEFLRAAVEQHHAQWPAEAIAWYGERALALHAYEMLRAGELLSVLDYSRLQKLRRDGQLKTYGQQLLAHIDDDELFYLQAVRRIAAGSEQTYRERLQTLDELQSALGALAGTSRYPTFAGDVLWRDLVWGIRLQACDRSLWGGWRAALHAAAGRPLPADAINPLTGAPYLAARSGAFWEVRDIDLLGDPLKLAEEPLLVRVLSP